MALLRRVREDGSLAAAEGLAIFLASDLVDSGLIPKFRTIARGVREGLVDPRTVRAAYRAAKKPGVNNPSALLWWYVVRHPRGLLESTRCGGDVELGLVDVDRRRIGFNGGRGGDLRRGPRLKRSVGGAWTGAGGRARARRHDAGGLRSWTTISH